MLLATIRLNCWGPAQVRRVLGEGASSGAQGVTVPGDGRGADKIHISRKNVDLAVRSQGGPQGLWSELLEQRGCP